MRLRALYIVADSGSIRSAASSEPLAVQAVIRSVLSVQGFKIKKMKIAQITDLHLCDGLAECFQINSKNNINKIFEDIKTENIDMLIFTGDFGSVEGIEYLNKKLKELKIEYYVVLGNHDKKENLIENGIIDNSYLCDRTIIKDEFIIHLLDSSKGYLDDIQIENISNQINVNKKNILFTHYPIIKSNRNVLDREFGIKLTQEQFNKIINLDIDIFCGHFHCYTESKINKIKQVTCPAAIMQIGEKDNKIITESFQFGYNIIEIKNKEIQYKPKLFVGSGVIPKK